MAKELNSYKLTDKIRKARRKSPLTSTEQALYYELVAICNDAEWDEVFSVSNSELCCSLMISENTLNSSRLSLINAGLVFYKSGKSLRQFSSYSFSKDITEKTVKNPRTTPESTSNIEVVSATISDTMSATNPEDYIQTETKTETKQNIDANASVGVLNFIHLETDSEKKKNPPAQKEKDAIEVLEHLNLVANKKYQPTKTNLGFISARLKEGNEIIDLKRVIEIKSLNWLNDHKMNTFLRPETLFNPTKFQTYIQEVEQALKNPKQYLNANRNSNNQQGRSRPDSPENVKAVFDEIDRAFGNG